MFGLKKRTSEVEVNDKVWMSAKAKWEACQDMFALNPNLVFVTWFEYTQQTLLSRFGEDKSNVIDAKKLPEVLPADRMLIFAEHYPLPKTEQALFLKLKLTQVPVLSSLDDPLFMVFGGEKIVQMMKRLGMEEGEVLGHPMITKAIRRAQSKMEHEVKIEQMASSQQEWFALNLK